MNHLNAYEQLMADNTRAFILARGICARHHLSADCERMTGGSRLLFASGHHVIKIFPPEEKSFYETEALFLSFLHGQLPTSTPELVAADSWEEYPYLVMERLDGIPFEEVWERLDIADRADLMSELGKTARALHSLPIAPLGAAPFQWHPFIDGQQRNLMGNHRAVRLPEEWLVQLPAYMSTLVLNVHDPTQMAPLHTELMPEHLFVKEENGHWAVSGLLDFEPSMVGHREYEFCAVGVFITAGQSDLFRLFLSAYGYPDAELDDETSRRIMMFLLLHRYCNLNRFRSLIPSNLEMTSLEQLQQYWFGL